MNNVTPTLYRIWLEEVKHDGKIKSGFMGETDFSPTGGVHFHGWQVLQWVTAYQRLEIQFKEFRIIPVVEDVGNG